MNVFSVVSATGLFVSVLKISLFYIFRLIFGDPLIVSKFHNETHDPKGQDNKIYTIMKGRETFYRRHIVPVTICSEVKYMFLKGYPLEAKAAPKN